MKNGVGCENRWNISFICGDVMHLSIILHFHTLLMQCNKKVLLKTTNASVISVSNIIKVYQNCMGTQCYALVLKISK